MSNTIQIVIAYSRSARRYLRLSTRDLCVRRLVFRSAQRYGHRIDSGNARVFVVGINPDPMRRPTFLLDSAYRVYVVTPESERHRARTSRIGRMRPSEFDRERVSCLAPRWLGVMLSNALTCMIMIGKIMLPSRSEGYTGYASLGVVHDHESSITSGMRIALR